MCLSRLGESLLKYSPQRPKLALIQYGPGEVATGGAEERPEPPEPEQEAAAPGIVPDVSAELDVVQRDFETAQASLSDVGGPDWPGYVLASRFVFADSLPFIARLEVKGVEWFDCFQEAAKIAARHQFRELWFHLHAQMIERSEKLEQPGMIGPSELHITRPAFLAGLIEVIFSVIGRNNRSI